MSRPHASSKNALHDLAGHVGQAKIAAVEAIGQLRVIHAQQVQDRGVQIVDADAIDRGLEADFVGFAVMRARL